MPQLLNDDLDALLAVLPLRVREAVLALADRDDLLEIVLDLGRLPEGRFPNHEVSLSDEAVSREDLGYVVERIGQFGDDNRAGIGRTLHRISAIRNRRGEVVGLTCRVGRAVRGTVTLLRDVIEAGRSLLILGRPGVGKTTLLREAARVLADELGKRVVVVDTSNEIAGDGDIPHPGIGRARRMQVAHPSEQHAVMIEAVENHMPEVIVIDEIGTELEAQAARTIAERGVQLVATAHGRTLENLLLNPTLSDLVGGIQAVTLGDEEARRRGTQKTVLERKAPPTFDVLVEQEERHLVGVHHDLASAVDGLLRGEAPQREMRERLSDGNVRRWKEHAPRAARADSVGLPAREAPPQREGRDGGRERREGRERRDGGNGGNRDSRDSRDMRDDSLPRRSAGGRGAGFAGAPPRDAWWEDRREERRAADAPRASDGGSGSVRQAPTENRWLDPELARGATLTDFDARDAADARELRYRLRQTLAPDFDPTAGAEGEPAFRKRRIYPMGVNRVRLEQVIRELGLPAVVSRTENDADAVLVLKSMYRKQPDRVDAAQSAGIPIYMLRSAGVDRLREAMAEMFHVALPGSQQELGDAGDAGDDVDDGDSEE